jgi:WD40 repeat protein
VDGFACSVTSLTFAAKSRLGLSRFDGALEVWDVDRRTRLLEHPAEFARAGPCVLSPDGERLAWADRHGGLHVCSVTTGEIVTEIPSTRQDNMLPRFAFSPDGRLVVPLIHGADIVTYRSNDLSIVHRMRGHSALVNGVAFSPDGSRLVSASSDTTLKIWDVESGRELATLHGHDYMALCVAFTPDGKTLISGGADKTVRFWDAGK